MRKEEKEERGREMGGREGIIFSSEGQEGTGGRVLTNREAASLGRYVYFNLGRNTGVYREYHDI
jgi:hypothetical protein